MELTLPFDAAWAVGLTLAIVRVAAFTVASPITGRAVPVAARLGFTIAVATAIATPVPGALDLPVLVTAVVVNAVVGATLGYVSGLPVHLFATAGSSIDLVSGLSVATVFDPIQGDQGAVFARLFHLTATTMFLIGGGITLLVGGLVASVRVLPLDAAITPSPGLAGLVIQLTSHVVRAGVELALPVIGVLLMLELALGLASRFAPQANVFMLGLPIKILAAITVVGASFVLFPDAVDGFEAEVGRTMTAVLRGFGA
ncbi:flagellar biosynthetic protein FliR [Nitriliruptoraceae bacterium ZYF776]|nr:flagellar biosynthetic protein FliR [Profundirhabdus halotolerans]